MSQTLTNTVITVLAEASIKGDFFFTRAWGSHGHQDEVIAFETGEGRAAYLVNTVKNTVRCGSPQQRVMWLGPRQLMASQTAGIGVPFTVAPTCSDGSATPRL